MRRQVWTAISKRLLVIERQLDELFVGEGAISCSRELMCNDIMSTLVFAALISMLRCSLMPYLVLTGKFPYAQES